MDKLEKFGSELKGSSIYSIMARVKDNLKSSRLSIAATALAVLAIPSIVAVSVYSSSDHISEQAQVLSDELAEQYEESDYDGFAVLYPHYMQLTDKMLYIDDKEDERVKKEAVEVYDSLMQESGALVAEYRIVMDDIRACCEQGDYVRAQEIKESFENEIKEYRSRNPSLFDEY